MKDQPHTPNKFGHESSFPEDSFDLDSFIRKQQSLQSSRKELESTQEPPIQDALIREPIKQEDAPPIAPSQKITRETPIKPPPFTEHSEEKNRIDSSKASDKNADSSLEDILEPTLDLTEALRQMNEMRVRQEAITRQMTPAKSQTDSRKPSKPKKNYPEPTNLAETNKARPISDRSIAMDETRIFPKPSTTAEASGYEKTKLYDFRRELRENSPPNEAGNLRRQVITKQKQRDDAMASRQERFEKSGQSHGNLSLETKARLKELEIAQAKKDEQLRRQEREIDRSERDRRRQEEEMAGEETHAQTKEPAETFNREATPLKEASSGARDEKTTSRASEKNRQQRREAATLDSDTTQKEQAHLEAANQAQIRQQQLLHQQRQQKLIDAQKAADEEQLLQVRNAEIARRQGERLKEESEKSREPKDKNSLLFDTNPPSPLSLSKAADITDDSASHPEKKPSFFQNLFAKKDRPAKKRIKLAPKARGQKKNKQSPSPEAAVSDPNALEEREETPKEKDRFAIFYYVIMAVAAVVIIYNVYLIGDYLFSKQHQNKINSQAPPLTQEQKYTQEAASTQQIHENILELQNSFNNRDIVGFVSIPNTHIDYPVTQRNSKYYLDHSVQKTLNKAGSISLDARNKVDGTDKNTILYGHHVRNGAMFHDLSLYQDPAFLDEHPNVFYIDLYNKSKYEVFSFYETTSNELSPYNQVEFNDDSPLTFQGFIDAVTENSLYDFNIEIKDTDQIFTMITTVEPQTSGLNTDEAGGNIYVLHGKKVE